MSKKNTMHKVVGETRLRVRYAETDQMGVVYYANYLVWFEVGRAELMRQRGLDYKRMEIETGCLMAVVDATVRYKAPARYDEELIVETTLTGVRRSVVASVTKSCAPRMGCCCARARPCMWWLDAT